ncbi:MAG: type II toxin-antitoxin system HicA family toxin [Candidatus Gracilibacteria bacterium]|nr:type II toxin-antitoxin system HicA family toxin [Candidatus Gracilibacteria bacterium]
MNPNIHNIKSKDILKFLLKNGFEISHQKGSHIQLKKGTFKVTIPNHSDKSLNIKTIISILKQAQIDKDNFLK